MEELAAAEFEEVAVGFGRRFGGRRFCFAVNPEAVGVVSHDTDDPLVTFVGDLVSKAEIRFAVGLHNFVADFEAVGVGEEFSVAERGFGEGGIGRCGFEVGAFALIEHGENGDAKQRQREDRKKFAGFARDRFGHNVTQSGIRVESNCDLAQTRRMRILTLIAFFSCVAAASADDLEIVTIAGTGERGFDGDGGAAAEAKINNPFGVVIGPDNHIYFCDTGNHVMRKIDRETGVITTVAGTGGVKGYDGDGGPATEAKCFEPYEVRFDKDGHMFFVEMQNHIVRRVDAKTGIISTVAGTGEKGFSGDGGAATKATFNRPHSIQFGADGNLYICDIGNHRVRRVDMKTGVVDTICGTGKSEGPPDGAKISPNTPLKGPRALDFDEDGNMWLALREGNAVFFFDFEAGTIHHIAGTGKKGFTGNGGPAKEATLSGPKGISIDPDGQVYLADTESHSVRYIDLNAKPHTLQLLAGDGQKGDGPDGDPLKCQMDRLHGVFVDPKTKEVFIGDSETNKVRVVRPKG